MFANLFLIESLSRVFTRNSTPDLQDLGGANKPHLPFVLLLVTATCVLICPGFFGFQYLVQSLLEPLEYGASVLWINLSAFLLMVVVGLMVIGTFLNEIYLKPKKPIPSLKSPSQPLNLMAPIFLFLLLVFWTIFALEISDLQIFYNWL